MSRSNSNGGEKARPKILGGHEKFAPIEKDQQPSLRTKTRKQMEELMDPALEADANGGPTTDEHPLLDRRGLPLPFNPEQDEFGEIIGDPLLYANANEADKEKLANKLGMSKDAVEIELKKRYELRQQPKRPPPRPTPL